MSKEIKKYTDQLDKMGCKSHGFKVPVNYFNTLDEDLLVKTSEKNNSKKEGFTTPDNYFENLENRILEQVNDSKPIKKSKVKPIRIVQFGIAIAASFILFFSISEYATKNTTTTIEDLTLAEIDSWLEENILIIDSYDIAENYENEIASLEDDFINAIPETNLLEYVDDLDFDMLDLE